MSAFNERIQPLRDLMKAKGLDAFVLRRNPNLAWAIAGRAHVPTTIDMACFDLIITQDSATAITNVVEAPRLIAEELPAEVKVQTVKWSEGRDPLLPTGSKVGCDQPGADRFDLGVEVEMIRASLIKSDLARFKEICVDAAVALGNAMKQVENSDREIDVAGLITHSLWQADLEIAFLGVAGQDRVHKFRHPLPTEAVVGNRVSASICAKHEWTKHHQGGPTGFLPRDWPANQSTVRLIAPNQPIAWNPTGKGWKAEDTIVATDSGVKLLSNDPDWPTFEVNGRTRAFLLQK